MATDTFDPSQHLDDLASQGYTLIRDFLGREQLHGVNEAFDRMLSDQCGRNEFEGSRTERIYTLVGRDRLFQDIVEDSRIMALCDAVLAPNYLLTASQAIVINPGETPQPWHTDDAFYPVPRPRPMISLSTIVAVEAFTAENGGTEFIPGSHLWDDARVSGEYRGEDMAPRGNFSDALEAIAIPLELPAGAAVVFAGTLLHRGGGNSSENTRRAFSNQYCQPWARTQENFYLSIPREDVAAMSPTVQSLLGYSIHPPFMGQVTAYHPRKTLEPGFVAPLARR